MTSFDIALPSDLFALKGNAFHDFLESMFSIEIRELARLQGFSTAHSLIHSSRHLLDCLKIDSDDSALLAIKQLVAFNQRDGTWIVKAGIQFDVDHLMSMIRRAEQQRGTTESNGSLVVSSEVLRAFPWLRAVIIFCQNEFCSNRNDLACLSSFVENVANNVIKPSSRHRYSAIIEQFAFVLFMLGGKKVFEFLRINLPGSIPSMPTLLNMYNEKREQLVEGQFRFDAMGNLFKSMNVQYAFASEDCTGVIQKVCYDRQSNSFVGFCPPLLSNGFPQQSSFNYQSFYDLENAFKTRQRSSLLNIHAIQAITPHTESSSPFLLSAYGTDNKYETHHILSRWLKIFEESLQRGVRIIGYSTDCDSRYLRTMRLVTNFFATLPNYDLRKHPQVLKIHVPTTWTWFYMDPKQLFVVLQVGMLKVESNAVTEEEKSLETSLCA